MGNKLDIDSYAEFQAKNGLDETNELVASIFELLIKYNIPYADMETALKLTNQVIDARYAGVSGAFFEIQKLEKKQMRKTI